MVHRTLVFAAALALAVGGCAPKAVLLTPVSAPLPEGATAEGPTAWSLWVASSQDVRPADRSGRLLGTLYTRFEKTPQDALWDGYPVDYLKAQLARYLLHRGLEASEAGRARVHLAIDLEEFSVTEVPGPMWDELTVKVGYTVRLNDPRGQELGRVKLEGLSVVKTPMAPERQVVTAFADALADTFGALTQSETFQTVLREATR